MNCYDVNNNPVDHLTQWETGRKLKIKGLNSSKIYEAHIFNARSNTAQVMATTNSGGDVTFEVLDKILQEPYMFTAVIHEKTNFSSVAVERIELPVEAAARPEKYVPTDPERPPITEYVLPIASDVTLGGVKGKKKTNENVPVAIDAQGRMFVPPYPAGGGGAAVINYNDIFTLSTGKMENISNGTNINTLQTPGNYYGTLYSGANILGLPSKKPNSEDAGTFYLKVLGSSSLHIQILYRLSYVSLKPYYELDIFTRCGTDTNGWTAWNAVFADNTDINKFVKTKQGYNNRNKLLATNYDGDVEFIDKSSIGGAGGSYTLPIANANTLGGVKAKIKSTNDTVEVSVDGAGKLYVPKYPVGGGGGSYTLPKATPSVLGGVKAKLKEVSDTVEVAVDATGKLYVPTYPTGGGNGSIDYKKVFALNENDGQKLNSSSNMNTLVKSGNYWGNSREVQIGAPPNFDKLNSRFYLKVIGSDYYVFQIMYCIVPSGSSYVSKIFSRSGYNNQSSTTFGQWGEFYNSLSDNSKLVQDVLKALPTWNGGEY